MPQASLLTAGQSTETNLSEWKVGFSSLSLDARIREPAGGPYAGAPPPDQADPGISPAQAREPEFTLKML